MYVDLHVSTYYSYQILIKLDFLDRLSKSSQISNFMKIHSVVAETFHTYRQTDMMKLTVSFHNFVNAPNKLIIYNNKL